MFFIVNPNVNSDFIRLILFDRKILQKNKDYIFELNAINFHKDLRDRYHWVQEPFSTFILIHDSNVADAKPWKWGRFVTIDLQDSGILSARSRIQMREGEGGRRIFNIKLQNTAAADNFYVAGFRMYALSRSRYSNVAF